MKRTVPAASATLSHVADILGGEANIVDLSGGYARCAIGVAASSHAFNDHGSSGGYLFESRGYSDIVDLNSGATGSIVSDCAVDDAARGGGCPLELVGDNEIVDLSRVDDIQRGTGSAVSGRAVDDYNTESGVGDSQGQAKSGYVVVLGSDHRCAAGSELLSRVIDN